MSEANAVLSTGWFGIWWERFPITRERRGWTPARIKAAQRAVTREAEKMPLFPQLRRISSVEERIAWADCREDALTTKLRAQRAQAWRRVRRELRSLSPQDRARVLSKWNTRFMPGTPQNLSATIRMVLSNT